MRIDRVRPDIAAPWIVAWVLSAAIPVGGMALDPGAADGTEGAWFGFLVTIALWSAVQSTVGTLILVRRPENRIGRLLQLSGVGIASVFGGFLATASEAVRPSDATVWLRPRVRQP